MENVPNLKTNEDFIFLAKKFQDYIIAKNNNSKIDLKTISFMKVLSSPFLRNHKFHFSLLQSFKKRVISTYIGESKLVASTVVILEPARVGTIISEKLDKTEYFFLDLHLLNVQLAEFLIAQNLNWFLSHVSSLGVYLSRSLAVIPVLIDFSYNFHNPFVIHDLYSLIIDSICLLGIPTMVLKFGKNQIMNLTFRNAHKFLHLS